MYQSYMHNANGSCALLLTASSAGLDLSLHGKTDKAPLDSWLVNYTEGKRIIMYIPFWLNCTSTFFFYTLQKALTKAGFRTTIRLLIRLGVFVLHLHPTWEWYIEYIQSSPKVLEWQDQLICLYFTLNTFVFQTERWIREHRAEFLLPAPAIHT